MKIFKLFTTKIFLRRAILSIGVLALIFLANYVTFIAARSIFSTLEGYQEIKRIDKKGNFIANLDPECDINLDVNSESNAQKVYDYLFDNFKYAFYTDGFIVDLKNDDSMDISLSYLNEEYYKLNKFDIIKGEDLDFDYQVNIDKSIPVLIGKGLSKTYPVGTLIKVKDPALDKFVEFKVQGVLAENSSHSNFYALNSKQYYNFSILVPVNNEFIRNSKIDLKLNGLMDLIITESDETKVLDLKNFIYDKLKLKFNFYSQKDNFDYFNDYFFSSLKFIGVITLVLLIIIVAISVWNAIVGMRLMLRDFTINLLVGLNYSKLRKIFYSYYGMMFLLNIVILLFITAYSRYGCWIRKDASFATYGIFGLINMDWLALLAVVLSDIIMGLIIVETVINRIKKVPISLGVLQ